VHHRPKKTPPAAGSDKQAVEVQSTAVNNPTRAQRNGSRRGFTNSRFRDGGAIRTRYDNRLPREGDSMNRHSSVSVRRSPGLVALASERTEPARDAGVRPDPSTPSIRPATTRRSRRGQAAAALCGTISRIPAAAVDLTERMPPRAAKANAVMYGVGGRLCGARLLYGGARRRDIRQAQNLASPNYVYHLARGPDCKGTNSSGL